MIRPRTEAAKPNQVTLDALVARSELGYPQNVRRAVLTRLFDEGTLSGTRDGKSIRFDDTPALSRVLGLGIEDFVFNTQGWCLCAVDAPIERVAEALRAHPLTLAYDAGAAVVPLEADSGLSPAADRREAFVIDCPAATWTSVVLTVHWIQGGDPALAVALAADLSASLGTRAAAMWDDDFSGAHLVAVDRGARGHYVGDESHDWEAVQLEVYRLGLRVPKCFIATDASGAATLHAADPSEVRRADRVALRVPSEQQVHVPHVFEKLGTMAGAIAEEPADEGEFSAQMIEAVWRQAESIRRAR